MNKDLQGNDGLLFGNSRLTALGVLLLEGTDILSFCYNCPKNLWQVVKLFIDNDTAALKRNDNTIATNTGLNYNTDRKWQCQCYYTATLYRNDSVINSTNTELNANTKSKWQYQCHGAISP